MACGHCAVAILVESVRLRVVERATGISSTLSFFQHFDLPLQACWLAQRPGLTCRTTLTASQTTTISQLIHRLAKRPDLVGSATPQHRTEKVGMDCRGRLREFTPFSVARHWHPLQISVQAIAVANKNEAPEEWQRQER